MDPITPITILLSALAVVTPALKSVTDQAVKDGYAALKSMIVHRFGPKNPTLERTLADHAKDPETYKAPMAKVLAEVGADGDQEILDRAVEVLKRAEAAKPGVTGGLVGQINAAGGRVVVAGTIHGGVRMGDELNRPSGA